MAARAPQQKAHAATWRIDLADEAATISFAVDVAQWLKPGDLLTLSGDLGTGKTTFARALIRALVGDPELDVPSPTFTLMQVYEGRIFPIVHADLFRIKQSDELAELGWDEAAEGALVVVEWPDRAGAYVSADRLDIAFAIDPRNGPDYRAAILTGLGSFAPRLRLAHAIHDILTKTGWADATREFMQGDASTRAYE